jgi:hypothetical protein
MKRGSWVLGLSAIILASILVSNHHALAQGSNASISGIVQDQSRALIPGVTITVTNDETGIALTTLTNEAGAYGFPSITPGKYTLSAALPGIPHFDTQGFGYRPHAGAAGLHSGSGGGRNIR